MSIRALPAYACVGVLWLVAALSETAGAQAAANLPAVAVQTTSQPAPVASQPAATRPSIAGVMLATIGFSTDETADPRDIWIATALEETLAERLRHAPGVIAIPTVRLYQARRELQDEEAELPDWPRVAAALGAKLMLTGRCHGPPEAVVLQISLKTLGPEAAARAEATLPTARVFDAIDAAMRWTLEQVGVKVVPPEAERLMFGPPCRSPSALDYYARAVAAARTDKMEDARYYALQSFDYDGHYRPPLAMLAQLELPRGSAGFNSAGTRLRMLSDLSRIAGDSLDWAAAEVGQGVVLQLTGAFDAAYTRFETALATAHEHDAPYGEIVAMNAIADAYLTRGRPPGAEWSDEQKKNFVTQNLRRAAEWQEAGLELLVQLGDVVAEVPACNKLALIYERLDERERALALHRRTLAASERAGSRRNQATAWLYIGQWYQREKRWPEAVDATKRCLELAAEPMKPVAQVALAGIYQGMNEPAAALEQFEQAYAKIRTGDDLGNQLMCARHIADLRMQLGRREAAITALQDAIDVAHAMEHADEAALREKLKDWKSQKP